MEKDIFTNGLAKLLYDYSGKIMEIHNLCIMISNNNYDPNLEIMLQKDLSILLKNKEKIRKKLKKKYYKICKEEFNSIN